MADHIAIRANGLWYAYRKEEWVLKDVSLSVPEGQISIIMGPSGTGKTTLLKLLAGILTPARGHVEVLHQVIRRERQRSQSYLVGYIPQQLGLVRNLTALQNILMGSLGRCGHGKVLLGIFPRHEIARAQAVLDLMGISHKCDHNVYQLSGGERQRVAIARTLLQRPKVVIADEFLSDLDLALALEILGRIRFAAEKERITFVLSMHRVGLAREFEENVLTLNRGEITRGFPSEPLREPAAVEILQ